MMIVSARGKSVLRPVVFFIAAAALLIASCNKQGSRAKELYDLAVFEEKQFNRNHAEKLYQEILDCCPDTAEASLARNALNRFSQSDIKRSDTADQ